MRGRKKKLPEIFGELKSAEAARLKLENGLAKFGSRAASLFRRLLLVEPAVFGAAVDKLGVRAVVHYRAVLENNYHADVADCAETVRDD